MASTSTKHKARYDRNGIRRYRVEGPQETIRRTVLDNAGQNVNNAEHRRKGALKGMSAASMANKMLSEVDMEEMDDLTRYALYIGTYCTLQKHPLEGKGRQPTITIIQRYRIDQWLMQFTNKRSHQFAQAAANNASFARIVSDTDKYVAYYNDKTMADAVAKDAKRAEEGKKDLDYKGRVVPVVGVLEVVPKDVQIALGHAIRQTHAERWLMPRFTQTLKFRQLRELTNMRVGLTVPGILNEAYRFEPLAKEARYSEYNLNQSSGNYVMAKHHHHDDNSLIDYLYDQDCAKWTINPVAIARWFDRTTDGLYKMNVKRPTKPKSRRTFFHKTEDGKWNFDKAGYTSMLSNYAKSSAEYRSLQAACDLLNTWIFYDLEPYFHLTHRLDARGRSYHTNASLSPMGSATSRLLTIPYVD